MTDDCFEDCYTDSIEGPYMVAQRLFDAIQKERLNGLTDKDVRTVVETALATPAAREPKDIDL